MGMYDRIHTGTRCGQTKAFSRLLDDLCPGDEIEEAADGAYAMREGGWLVIVHRVLVGWEDEAVDETRRFDNRGDPLEGDVPDGYRYDIPTREATAARISRLSSHSGDVLTELIDKAFAARVAAATGKPHDCDICAELRSSVT